MIYFINHKEILVEIIGMLSIFYTKVHKHSFYGYLHLIKWSRAPPGWTVVGTTHTAAVIMFASRMRDQSAITANISSSQLRAMLSTTSITRPCGFFVPVCHLHFLCGLLFNASQSSATAAWECSCLWTSQRAQCHNMKHVWLIAMPRKKESNKPVWWKPRSQNNAVKANDFIPTLGNLSVMLKSLILFIGPAARRCRILLHTLMIQATIYESVITGL